MSNIHSCPRCGYTTKSAQSFTSHLLRKFVCKPPGSVVTKPKVSKTTPTSRLDCPRCGKHFSHASSLSRHKRPCMGTTNGSELEELKAVVQSASVEQVRVHAVVMEELRQSAQTLRTMTLDEKVRDDKDLRSTVLELQKKVSALQAGRSTKAEDTAQSQGTHFIYLVRKNDFALRDEDTYKVGLTVQEKVDGTALKRVKAYGKDVEVYYTTTVTDCYLAETLILERFNTRFERYQYGREWFVGCPSEMKGEISKILLENNLF